MPGRTTNRPWSAAALTLAAALLWLPAPSVSAACSGVEVDVVGKGRVCLDPADEARREFQECRDGHCGPRMVVVPAGNFMMGSSEAEVEVLMKDFPSAKKEWVDDETPQLRVTIGQPFAVGKFEVTFAEWDACVAAKGCRHRPDDWSWGRGQRPVIDVSWDDVRSEYLPWLNKALGLSVAGGYRLLSEAEWEYAARAGTTTWFSFGPTISTDQANYHGRAVSGAGIFREKTIEVGSFPGNAFGLHDMHGNVWEWVEDHWSANYAAAPTDGSAWTKDDDMISHRGTSGRIIRGGSWINGAGVLRSANRYVDMEEGRANNIGFRVARSLSR